MLLPAYLPYKGTTLLKAIQRQSLTSGLIQCLDVGDASSYGGSGQAWTDVSGTGNDMRLGTTTGVDSTDPVFNGTSGLLTNYWTSNAGTSLFRQSSGSWDDFMHKDGAKFSWAMVHYQSTTEDCQHGNAAASASNIGVLIGCNSGGITFECYNGSGTRAAQKNTATSLLASGRWHFTGSSIDENGGANGSFHYANGGYAQVGGSDTWNASYTSPSASAASVTLDYCFNGLGANTRLALFALWNTNLSKANFDSLFQQLRNRFNIVG